jgi:hypothetical protein
VLGSVRGVHDPRRTQLLEAFPMVSKVKKRKQPGWLTFLDGQRGYLEREPCPKRPTDETCHSNEAGEYYGWMIARSRDVLKIIEVIKLIGIHGTKQGDKIMAKLVDIHDKQRGFKRQ